MLTPKQRVCVRDAQMRKWKGFGEVKIPADVVDAYSDEIFAIYRGATFPSGRLDSPDSLSALETLCDEAELELDDDARPADMLRLLIAAWRTRWVRERESSDDGEEIRSKRIIRYWLDAIERIDWDAIGKAATSNLGRFEGFAALAAGTWTMSKDAMLVEDSPALLVAYVGKRALLAIPVIAKKSGGLAPPDQSEPLLLNPYYFPATEADLSEWSIALSGDVRTHVSSNVTWQAHWESIVASFAEASIDLQAPTTMANRSDAMNVRWCVSDTADVSAAVVWIARAYRQLLNEKLPRLFERALTLEDAADKRRTLPVRPGHVDEYLTTESRRRVFPMDRSQRRAVSWAASLEEDEALVVNGPPGTGKTTFLRGVIATKWLEPLLTGTAVSFPPIIVGTGATNIAVQNILGAFDAAPAPPNERPTRFDERWIPGVASYGWFFPSASRETHRQSLREKDGRLQYLNTSGTLLNISDPENGTQHASLLKTIESAYLDAAERTCGQKFDHVESVVSSLRTELRSFERKRRTGLNQLADAVIKVANGCADDQLRSRVPLLLEEFVAASLPEHWKHLRDDSRVEKERASSAAAVAARVEGTIGDDDLLHTLGAFSETAYSTVLFHVAARIWEGRWIIAQESRNITEFPDVREELRIAAMLGPCIVSTFHTLPSIARDEFGLRFGLFDLLIIDEAGQAGAEIAAASIAFGKRLLVVGDAEQLQPIPKVNESEDRDLLARADLEDLATALRLSSGSALRIAKHLTVFRPLDPDKPTPVKDRGVTLKYHYRCRDEIIEFCNGLRYSGELVASRPKLTEEPPWPPMSYVFTDGHFGGEQSVAENKDAWSNRLEAIEIAEWLREERATLEEFYKRPLSEIVAVITPFVGQEAILTDVIRERLGYKDKTLDGMVVGTVSKLQGAEKHIVLFSSVVTGDKPSKWVDENEHLINVAVSRAKDSFVFFGAHAILFKLEAKTALSKLGNYMTAHGRMLYPEELLVVEAPGKVKKIGAALGRRKLVLPSGGHFRDLPPFAEPEPDWKAVRFVESKEGSAKIDAIAQAARKLPTLVLATDDDREGEAIAWHVLDALSLRGVSLDRENVLRMRFSNLAKDTLREARAKAAVGLDLGRVRAALTRSVIDYLLGKRYAATIGTDDGVGRVQAALLLAALRYERRRESSDARYVMATIEGNDGLPVAAWLVEDKTSVSDRLVNESRAQSLKYDESAEVVDLGDRSVVRIVSPPRAPATADMLIAAARQLKQQPARTMHLLESLYLGTKR